MYQHHFNDSIIHKLQIFLHFFPVHPTDTLRVDIVIPYEQHFYLKAPSSHERHAWLVALGSAKAGIPPAIPQPKVEKGM